MAYNMLSVGTLVKHNYFTPIIGIVLSEGTIDYSFGLNVVRYQVYWLLENITPKSYSTSCIRGFADITPI